MIEPGFYRGVPNDAYHGGPGLSRSGISRLLRSPAHFKVPVEETEAMRFGSAMELLEGDGEAEICGYWYDPLIPEVLCKFRIDWLRKPSGACVDLKSTKDARPSYFIRAAYNFGYHLQCAHYTYGLTQITKVEHDQFFFVCVEKEPPFGVNVYQAAPDFIQLGQIECQKGVKIYADCLKSRTWPAYPDQTLSLPLPDYIRRSKMPVFYD